MELGPLCDRVLELVEARGDGHVEAQVTASRTRHGLTRFANSAIHQHHGEDTTSISLKVAAEGKVASVSTSRIDDEGLRRLVDDGLAAASVRPVDPDWPGLAPPHAVPDTEHLDEGTFDADPSERAEHVRAFVDAGQGLNAAGYVASTGTEVSFANSLGHRTSARSTRATVDGIHRTETSAGGAHATSVALGDLDGGEVGATAAHLARLGADPQDVEPGDYEVVLGPEAVANIVVFLAFYGFNAKQHLEGQSFAALGEQQFDPAITLRDDALDVSALGTPFDAEGTAKQPLVLIDRGVTRALTHDRRTARRAGAETTGHAVPGGEAWGAFPTDLLLEPGDGGHVEDLIRTVERGIFINEFWYCRILDPKTQVTTGLTRNGTFLIEDGEITRPLTNLRFTESFVDALAPGRVRAVGSPARQADSEFGPGLCAVPPLHLASWAITGNAQG